MRAYVTGASGFVGRHLCNHLEAFGDEIIRADHHPVRGSTAIDVTDERAVRDHMLGTEPEVVYHLAGQADVGGSWKSPNETFQVNLHGTLNVLAGARAANVRRVISVTSADIYGLVTPEQLPLDEQSPLRPVSPYAASKASADMACMQAFLGYQQDVIRVRAFNHLGPLQSPRFVASALAYRVAMNEKTGETEVPVGDLSPRRDFTDVRDVARAYHLLATSGDAGEAYNICSGVDHQVQDLADHLLGMAKHPMTLVGDPELMRPVDLPVLRGSYDKLHAATGWKPEFTLPTTLSDLLAWHRSEIA